MFLLQYVQPGLAGLMDGSVSTLAPYSLQPLRPIHTWETFLSAWRWCRCRHIDGLRGGRSDDGSLTGRGTPWLRGTVCGVMTTSRGGPYAAYLIHDFWVRHSCRLCGRGRTRGDFLYPLSIHGHAILSAAFQVVLGGTLVFLAGIFIGSS